jgi:hypothetical protein
MAAGRREVDFSAAGTKNCVGSPSRERRGLSDPCSTRNRRGPDRLLKADQAGLSYGQIEILFAAGLPLGRASFRSASDGRESSSNGPIWRFNLPPRAEVASAEAQSSIEIIESSFQSAPRNPHPAFDVPPP